MEKNHGDTEVAFYDKEGKGFGSFIAMEVGVSEDEHILAFFSERDGQEFALKRLEYIRKTDGN